MAGATIRLDIAKAMVAEHKKNRGGRESGGGFSGAPHSAARPADYFICVKIGALVALNKWAALECTAEGILIDGGMAFAGVTPIHVIGPPAKPGLIMVAEYDAQTDKWIAQGYPHLIPDVGDNPEVPTVPVVIEGGVYKWKYWTTINGITWTRIKITEDTTTC